MRSAQWQPPQQQGSGNRGGGTHMSVCHCGVDLSDVLRCKCESCYMTGSATALHCAGMAHGSVHQPTRLHVTEGGISMHAVP